MIKLFKDNEITEEEFLRRFDNNEAIFPEKEYLMIKGFGAKNNQNYSVDFSDYEINENITFSVFKNIKNRKFIITFIDNRCSICSHVSVIEVVE